MLLQKRFPRDIRHFMVMKRVISSPLSSALIDERRCRAILWARDLTQKAPQRPNLRRLWAIYRIQKHHDNEEMTTTMSVVTCKRRCVSGIKCEFEARGPIIHSYRHSGIKPKSR